jgi:MarR family transcriptional regulator for hemolysin
MKKKSLASTEDLGMRLGQVHRLWRTVIDRTVQPLGLTQSRWTALMYLRHLGDGCTQKQLAESLGIELPSMSRTLDQLERQGLVRRYTSHSDRRARQVCFTPEGQQVLVALDKRATAVRERMLADVPEEEVEALRRGLTLIERNAWIMLSS